MKEKIKTFFCVLFLACSLPYIITLCLQGKEGQPNIVQNNASEKTDTKQDGKEEKESDVEAMGREDLDIEEFLVGVVAAQIPMNYASEALKAQAVIARTNVKAALEQDEELPESLSQEKLLDMWGEEGYLDNYQRLSKAVESTRGVVMRYQGNYVYAAFHAVSAGRTRNAKEALESDHMPWLEGTDSTSDIPSEEFLKVTFFEKKEFAERLKTSFPELEINEEAPLEGMEITARDSGDYVLKMTYNGMELEGEEFRNALRLPSACLYIKEVEGKIRIVTKGLGHGLGMSQYGANVMAGEGSSYEDILNYYFKNIEISD
ncbi:MAG: SpoIID/LytB domain-containing protein [Lachnospiraceae bacterium]|nr:SpoIID/LytB domain-containing protein [Lachnospiraceae bacterium]